ncbi:hypothetical protein EVAR_20228_1 [Eumeta japonica]|uniref:Uncharacterized protein n=1 Tax=Eumeta variegata TaxID=151549 RepID=A0A4C1WAR3_EUMVA|nr:hypothetical protein EVAR_20228_1 [Eumeta japonica]
MPARHLTEAAAPARRRARERPPSAVTPSRARPAEASDCQPDRDKSEIGIGIIGDSVIGLYKRTFFVHAGEVVGKKGESQYDRALLTRLASFPKVQEREPKTV